MIGRLFTVYSLSLLIVTPPFLYSVLLFDRRRFVYLVQKAGGPKKIVDKENRVIHSPKG